MTEEGSKYPFVSDQTHNCIKRTPCFLAKDVSSLYLYVLPKNKRDKNHVFLLSGVGCSILLQKHPTGCIAEFQSLANTRGITATSDWLLSLLREGLLFSHDIPPPFSNRGKVRRKALILWVSLWPSTSVGSGRWISTVTVFSDFLKVFFLNNKTWEKLGTYMFWSSHFWFEKRNLLTKIYGKYMEITRGMLIFFVWYHLLWTWSSFLWYSICDNLTLSW